jgi:hypothetical protein
MRGRASRRADAGSAFTAASIARSLPTKTPLDEQLGDVDREGRVGRRRFGEPEVEEPRPARGVDQDVGAAQVAVRYARSAEESNLIPQSDQQLVGRVLEASSKHASAPRRLPVVVTTSRPPDVATRAT